MQDGNPTTAGWSGSAKKNTPQTILVAGSPSPKIVSTSAELSASLSDEYEGPRASAEELIVCASALGSTTRSPGPSMRVVPSSRARCGWPETTIWTPQRTVES